MANSVVTPGGILAFPTFFEARSAVPGQEPRFSTLILFDEAAQKTKEFKELQDQIVAAIKEKFGAQPPKNLRMPIRDAAEKSEYAGFTDGKVFISAWSKQRPGIVDAMGNEIHAKDDVWAGQLARLYVRPFGYDTSGNKGVGVMLEHVQILKKDLPRTDGRKSAAQVFGKVASDELEDAI